MSESKQRQARLLREVQSEQARLARAAGFWRAVAIGAGALAALLAGAVVARATTPPAGVAYPYYLGFVACTEADCETRYRAIYVESATACTTTAILLLPQVLMPGETVEEWWCE